MIIPGIIAEYNPFHQGHAFQIQTLKKKLQANYVIIAMSGNFVQRGAPAMTDKFSRARMALSCGADLVLELPVLYASSSAEYFARGGVSLLNSTGVVTHLGFGTETEQTDLLLKTASVLNRQPEDFRQTLRKELKKGLSFPAARTAALKKYFESQNIFFSADGEQILSSPNNILAVEYLKALEYYHSPILPCPVLRRGADYHDTALDRNFCSASAIRKHCRESAESSLPVDDIVSKLPGKVLPEPALDILKQYPHPFLWEDDFSMLLHYKLLTESAEQLSLYADSSPDLAHRIKKEIGAFRSWSSFCEHMKTKNITFSRLSRMFLHILLDIYQEDYRLFPKPSCLRILGFRKSAVPLLSAMQHAGSLPLVTSPAQAGQTLSDSAYRLLAYDLKASELYRAGVTARGDFSLKNDYRQPVIRL